MVKDDHSPINFFLSLFDGTFSTASDVRMTVMMKWKATVMV
jgi:hypothetical protein